MPAVERHRRQDLLGGLRISTLVGQPIGEQEEDRRGLFKASGESERRDQVIVGDAVAGRGGDCLPQDFDRPFGMTGLQQDGAEIGAEEPEAIGLRACDCRSSSPIPAGSLRA